MARSTQEILNGILATKAQIPELYKFTSTSQVAAWRLIYYVTAVGINLMEQFWDLFKKDLETIKDNSIISSAKWWNDKFINFFQFDPTDPERGVLLIGDDYIPRYKIVDDTKKIVKFSSASQLETSKSATIKLAKADGDGLPTQLEQDELLAALSFRNNMQSMGNYINVVSFPADILKFNIDLYVDGQYGVNDVEDAVREAIKNYLANLKFDGTVEVIRMVDAIQNVPGVTDVEVKYISGTPSGGSEEAFTRVYYTSAGYIKMDDAYTFINKFIS